MKILNSEQIRSADAFTIKNEPVKSINLMERAAWRCVDWIEKKIDSYRKREKKIFICCGLGNNGGDGLAIARQLIKNNYRIEAILIRHSDKISDDCKTNWEKLPRAKSRVYSKITEVHKISEMPALSNKDIIIDAIFGSGLTRPVEGLAAEVIEKINRSGAFVVSVDIPSGLFSEDNSQNNPKAIVNADVTLTFQALKPAFLFPENYKYVGECVILDIGLDKGFIDSLETPYYMIDETDVRRMLKTRGKFDHKGSFGHGLLLSGSYGKMGAAVLGARAAMRSGAGLISVHIPKAGYNILQSSVPEAMVSIDDSEHYISSLPDISKYNAIAAGPGIDKKEETQRMLKLLIQNSQVPVILDADALNILSENKTWLSFLPKGSILSPHPKEFERLAGKAENSLQRIQMQKEFSDRYGVYVIYKGAYTTVSAPGGKFYFNSTGNPGMATGGSGDALTGILLGLKACGYSSLLTCIIGTFIHGLAGDITKGKLGEEALIAGDIVDNISAAFMSLK